MSLPLGFLPRKYNRQLKENTMLKLQKQPPEVFCEKRCSYEFRNIHRKATVLDSLFTKVAGLKVCSFIKKRLQHRCFPVNIAKFLRTPILKNICKWLPLKLIKIPSSKVIKFFRWLDAFPTSFSTSILKL